MPTSWLKESANLNFSKRFAVLLACSLWILANRIHTYHQPVQTDQGLYAAIGHELNLGGRLYTDLWDLKPPLIFMIYAGMEKLVGYGQQQIFVLGLLAALASLGAIYRASARLQGSESAGLWAAAFWALACNDVWLEANLPNAEVFLNALTLWGLVFYLDREPPSRQRASGVAAAVCFGLATLFKQPILMIPVCCLAAEAIAFRRDPVMLRRVAQQAFTLVLVTGLLWAGTFGYFALRSRAADFLDAVVRFGQSYAQTNLGRSSTLWQNIGNGLMPSVIFNELSPRFLGCLVPMALTAVVAGLAAWKRKVPHWVWVAGGYVVGTHVAVALPGRFYGHYFQLWIAPLALLAGCAVAEARHRSPRLARIVGGMGVFLLFLYEAPVFAKTPDDCSRLVWGERFVSTRHLAQDIGQWLTPHETLFQWGHEAPLYFYSQRRPASQFLEIVPLFMGPFQERYRQRLIQEFNEHPPEFIATIQPAWRGIALLPADLRGIFSSYIPFPGKGTAGFYVLLIRKGGALDRRLREGGRT